MIIAVRPRYLRAFVHLRPVGRVEFGGFMDVTGTAQSLGPEVGVFVPQLRVARELVEHLRPLAVPLRVFFLGEYLFGHVARTDDGAWHDAGDLFAWPGEAEDVPGQDADAFPGLLQRTR